MHDRSTLFFAVFYKSSWEKERMEGNMDLSLIVVLISAAALVLAGILYRSNKNIRVENERLEELSGFVRTGAMAFLTREYKVIAIFVAVLFVLLIFVMGWQVAVCFLAGALLSVTAGYIGMKSATYGNARTAQAAMKGEKQALNVAFTAFSASANMSSTSE